MAVASQLETVKVASPVKGSVPNCKSKIITINKQYPRQGTIERNILIRYWESAGKDWLLTKKSKNSLMSVANVVMGSAATKL